jgi:hypothetical protein
MLNARLYPQYITRVYSKKMCTAQSALFLMVHYLMVLDSKPCLLAWFLLFEEKTTSRVALLLADKRVVNMQEGASHTIPSNAGDDGQLHRNLLQRRAESMKRGSAS